MMQSLACRQAEPHRYPPFSLTVRRGDAQAAFRLFLCWASTDLLPTVSPGQSQPVSLGSVWCSWLMQLWCSLLAGLLSSEVCLHIPSTQIYANCVFSCVYLSVCHDTCFLDFPEGMAITEDFPFPRLSFETQFPLRLSLHHLISLLGGNTTLHQHDGTTPVE